MKSTVITLDIKTKGQIKSEFTGSIFRGWLGFILKCDPKKLCDSNCDESSSCPYFMVFKEKIDIKPYSLLSFRNGNFIRNFIRIHGDRRRFSPAILSDINDKAASLHYGGFGYSIELLEATNIEIPNSALSDSTTVAFISPVQVLRNRRTEVIPSFDTLLASCVRSFNRITKYYDPEAYPYKISDKLLNSGVQIQDFDIRTMRYVHSTIRGKPIKLEGSLGWVRYDTSSVQKEAGEVLKMGEALQIGKHTTYGLGGLLINKET